MRGYTWLLTGTWLTAACATTTPLPTEDRAAIEREVMSRPEGRYLKLSFYVQPFFGDGTKKLLSAVPPEEVRLIETTNGKPVSPGQTEKIIPAGTRVRIRKLEFPTAWVMAERVVYTPRTQPWVYLSIEGESSTHPFIIVLRPQIKTRQEFYAELERYVTEKDPAVLLARWPEFVREAVRTKTAAEGMPAEALEMAWGYPERRHMTFDNSVEKEEWIYVDGRRRAYVAEGRVERTQTERK
jgi:hypothetical protein